MSVDDPNALRLDYFDEVDHPTVQFIGEVLSSPEANIEQMGQAAALCENLLAKYRQSATVVFMLGTLYLKADKRGIAEALLRRAAAMDPAHPAPLNNLAFICQSEGRTDEAEMLCQKVLKRHPENLEALANIASCYLNNGTPDKALYWCERALKVDPKQADSLWNRALAYMEKGDWPRGWKAYREGMNLNWTSSTQRKKRWADLPYWNGGPGQEVIVYGEQGIGDEIMSYGMLPDAIERAEGRLILEAHPRLVEIARAAFGDRIAIYGTRKVPEKDTRWREFHPDTYAKIPILGLGEYCRNTAEDFQRQHTPYLVKDAARVQRYETLLASDKPLRIGLSWEGGTPPTRQDLRSAGLQTLAPLLQRFNDRVQWVSLQYDPAQHPGVWAPIVEKFCAETGVDMDHNTYAINDLDECYAGLIHTMDLVISVNTALVHACGAYGVKCWVLTPHRVAWRYGLTGPHMPWYGEHVTLYRQREKDGGAWGHVMERLTHDLEALVQETV